MSVRRLTERRAATLQDEDMRAEHQEHSPNSPNVQDVAIEDNQAKSQRFSSMRSATDQGKRTRASRNQSHRFSRSHKTTHAVWNTPLHPAAWEGLPPKPWRQASVSIAHNSDSTFPATSTQPAVHPAEVNVA